MANDETVRYNLQLEAAQMLKTLAEVNAKAGSIPEVLKNTERALQSFASKFGISFGAAQREMQATLVTAENLRALLKNPITAPTVTPVQREIAGAQDPYKAAGLTHAAGQKAMNDQRAKGLVLQKQEAQSEAAVAKEINEAQKAEERKAAALKNTLRLQAEERKLLEDSARIRNEEAAKRTAQRAAAANAVPNNNAYPTTPGYPSKEEQDALADRNKKFVETLSGVEAKNGKLILGQTEYNKLVASGAIEQDKLGNAAQKAGNSAKKAGDDGESGSKKATFATRAWSIAIGMLIHQGINLLINALQKMFTMAITGLRELETATFNLVNAEEKLSKAGVDITPKDLDSYIKKLQELNPLLSKIQATELVSTVSAKVAPNVGLGKDEIESLTQSIAILALRNKGLGKSVEEVESQINNAFLSGKVSVGINQLGVKISDQIVKEKALALGLVKTAEAYEKLNAAEEVRINAKAMVQILKENTDAERSHLPEYFETADAKFGIFQARMQDFFTKIGELLAPVLMSFFDVLAKGFEKGLEWLNKNNDALVLMANIAAELIPIIFNVLGLLLKFASIGVMVFENSVSSLQKLIDKIPALKKFVEILGSITGKNTDISLAVDTPTGAAGGSIGATSPYGAGYKEAVQKAEGEITEIMKDARDKRLDLEQDFWQKLADLARDYSRKLADIAVGVRRKIADAYADNAKKLEDINSDAATSSAEARQEAHEKEIESERKYQQELKDLQQKFLMDLEEALHERDARAILRIIRQHNIDKKALKEKRKTEKQEERHALAQKLADIEQERKQKLAEAQRELEEKLKEIQLAAARERQDAATAHRRALEDARLAHNRALAEQREFLQRKLRDLASAIANEYNLTAAGAQAIAQLLNAYFGSGGVVSSIFNGLQAALSSATSGAAPLISPTWAEGGLFGTGGLAEGGTFLATRPQTINVAENRPELITATPLGRAGSDVNKMFSDAGVGGGNGNGKLELAVNLSPDLEGRVIRRAMDETANVVVRINRSRT